MREVRFILWKESKRCSVICMQEGKVVKNYFNGRRRHILYACKTFTSYAFVFVIYL